MSLLAALVLAAASARVDSVYMTNTTDQRLAIRVALTGTPGHGGRSTARATAARVSVMDAALGGQFAGGRHFSWTPPSSFDPALLASTPVKLDRLEIAATGSEVSVLLHVPPEVAVDVRRDTRGLLLVFRSATPHGGRAVERGAGGPSRRGADQVSRPRRPSSRRRFRRPLVAAPAPMPAAERKPAPAPVVPAAPKHEPSSADASRRARSRDGRSREATVSDDTERGPAGNGIRRRALPAALPERHSGRSSPRPSARST